MIFLKAHPSRPSPLLALITTTLLGLACPLAAQDSDPEPLVTDRPDFTESTVSVQPGRVQLEAGYTWEEAGDVESQTFGEVLVRIGLSEGIELRLAANSYARESSPEGDSNGLENSLIGIKVETTQASEEPSFQRPATALLLGTTIPTGSSATREPHLEPGLIYALDWNTGVAVGVAANVGVFYASDEGDQFLLGTFSTAFGLDLGHGWGGFLEYFNHLPEGSERDARHFLDAGLTLLLSPDFQLDLRAGTEVGGGETDYFVGAGLAYRW